MLQKSLDSTKKQVELYFSMLEKDQDNELIRFLYESYQRQYQAELDTFEYLQGGEN